MKGWRLARLCTPITPCCKQPRRHEMKNSYLGPEFSDSRIESDLKQANLRYRNWSGSPCSTRWPSRLRRAMS